MARRSRNEALERELRYTRRTVFGLIGLCVLLILGWMWASREITVYTPPDISKAYLQKADDIPAATIYGFARTLWETLNYCEKDCGEEYPQQLAKHRVFITDACMAELDGHYKSNRIFYSHRSRVMLPTDNAMFSDDKVEKHSSDIWIAYLEYTLKEVVSGRDIRSSTYVYPIYVIRSTRPRSVNPLGLEINCFHGAGPQVVTSESPATGV